MDKLEILLKDTNTELRKYARLNSKFITIQLGPSVDISEGGICVIVEDPLRIGHEIDVIVLLTTTHAVGMQKPSIRIKLEGVVIWTKYSKLLGKYKVGIRFAGKNYYGKAKIKSFIDKHFIETYKYNNPESFHKKKICMFVFNNFKHDTRVLKEVKTLVSAGYLVTVVAMLSNGSCSYEEKDGYRIFRLTTPLFYVKIVKEMLGKSVNFQHLFNVFHILAGRYHAVSNFFYQTVKKPIAFLLRATIRAVNCFVKQELKVVEGKGTNSLHLFNVFRILAGGFYVMSNFFYQTIKKPITFLLRAIGFFNQKLTLFKRSIVFLDFYLRSLSLVKKMPADIYHAHDLNMLLIAWWAARKNGAKLVYDSHELYLERNRFSSYTRLGKFIVGRIEAFLIRRAHAVITVNETIANELASRYMVQIPEVVMNVPSMESSAHSTSTGNGRSLRAAIGMRSDRHLILYSGSITFNRGLEKVIESLVYLPDCHLVLMGYGSDKYKAGLQALARKIGVESRFSFVGPVPSEEVMTYAACADLGIAPIKNVCLSYYYCLPNKLFEYILAGVPVIASNFPEMEKVIHKYEIGYTFDPEDSRGIARVIRKVLDNRQHYQKMKQNTITASHAYNWEKESKKLLEIYQTLS